MAQLEGVQALQAKLAYEQKLVQLVDRIHAASKSLAGLTDFRQVKCVAIK